MKFVSDLRQVDDFLRVILLKVALNTITLTLQKVFRHCNLFYYIS